MKKWQFWSLFAVVLTGALAQADFYNPHIEHWGLDGFMYFMGVCLGTGIGIDFARDQ